MVVAPDYTRFSFPIITMKMYILKWPFIVGSLMHTCALTLLSHQHLDVPNTWGGWIICALTQSWIDLRTMFQRNWSFVHIKKIYIYPGSWSSAHKKFMYNSVQCTQLLQPGKYLHTCCATLYFYSLAQYKVKSLMILKISIHLMYSKPLPKKKSSWKCAVCLRVGMGSIVNVGNPVRIRICHAVRTFNPLK